MTRLLPLVALGLTGCGNGVWGTYLVEIEALPALDCETTVTENWENAAPIGDVASEWTQTTDVKLSAGLFFAEMLELEAKKAAVLVVDGETYKGTWDSDAKEWVFSHSNIEDGTVSSDHASGYSFTQSGLNQLDRTFRMNLKEGTGSLAVTQTIDTTWTESDEWDASVGFSSGQISAIAVQFLDGNRVINENTGPECSGSTCELSVVANCSGQTTFTFTAVGTDEDGLYGAVDDAGQPIGLGQEE